MASEPTPAHYGDLDPGAVWARSGSSGPGACQGRCDPDLRRSGPGEGFRGSGQDWLNLFDASIKFTDLDQTNYEKSVRSGSDRIARHSGASPAFRRTRSMSNSSSEGSQEEGLLPSEISEVTIKEQVEVQRAVDLKAWAAYRLGHLSTTVWFRYEVFWKFGDANLWPWSRQSCEELKDSIEILYSLIHPNLTHDLINAVTRFENKTSLVIDPSSPYSETDSNDYRSRNPPFRHEWEIVRVLADQALDTTREVRTFYDLGSCLGQLRLKLWDHGPGSIFNPQELERHYDWIEGGGSDPLPDMRPLVRAALRLPEEVVKQIPYFETLVNLVPLIESSTRDDFLKNFMRRHSELSPQFSFAEEVDHSTVSRMLDALDDEIAARLKTLTTDIRSPLSLHDKTMLSWDPHAGELKHGTKVIRKYATQAKTARTVLEKFSTAGWPLEIPDPFGTTHYHEQLRSAARSLNTNLLVIKFKVHNNKIAWQWRGRG